MNGLTWPKMTELGSASIKTSPVEDRVDRVEDRIATTGKAVAALDANARGFGLHLTLSALGNRQPSSGLYSNDHLSPYPYPIVVVLYVINLWSVKSISLPSFVEGVSTIRALRNPSEVGQTYRMTPPPPTSPT